MSEMTKVMCIISKPHFTFSFFCNQVRDLWGAGENTGSDRDPACIEFWCLVSADVPCLVCVLSQLLWSVRRVCCVPLSHPLISEDEEEVGGSVGFTKESRGECLGVRWLVAQTENRDYCYQLILAGCNSGGWIKEENRIFVCRTEHYRHNCAPIFFFYLFYKVFC